MRERDGANARTLRGTASPSVLNGLGFRLGLVHRRLRSAWEESIADLGVSAPQAVMLRAVSEWPGMGLRGLARRLRTDAMNAKRLADHLEQLGLVVSSDDPQHRQRRVLHPTGDGRRVAASLTQRADAWERRLAAQVGADELKNLFVTLAHIDKALQAPRSPAVAMRSPGPERERPA